MRTFGSLSATATVVKRFTDDEVTAYLTALSQVDTKAREDMTSMITEASLFL